MPQELLSQMYVELLYVGVIWNFEMSHTPLLSSLQKRKENTSSHALSPLTTMFGRNLVIETGIGSSSFRASKDASLVIR